MNLNQFNDDTRRILRHYGKENQVGKAMEEFGEAIDALKDYVEYGDKEHAIEEVADCLIMGMQMASLLGVEKVEAMMRQKIDRQFKRMELGKYE